MEKQDDWINLALAYLRVCAIASEAKAIDEELQQVTDGLSASETPHLGESSDEFIADCTASSHNAFTIDRIDHQASYDGAPDTSSVQVEIKNKLSTVILHTCSLASLTTRGFVVPRSRCDSQMQRKMRSSSLRNM